MISIADMESSPAYEDMPESPEAEEQSSEKQPARSSEDLEPPSGVTSPIRCSICITKVTFFLPFICLILFTVVAERRSRCN